jgi:hypothetical protein
MLTYWRDIPADRLRLPGSPERSDTHERLEGLMFSVLVALDGGSMHLPAIQLVTDPHPEDGPAAAAEGTDWWPSNVIINDGGVEMHDEFSKFVSDRYKSSDP